MTTSLRPRLTCAPAGRLALIAVLFLSHACSTSITPDAGRMDGATRDGGGTQSDGAIARDAASVLDAAPRDAGPRDSAPASDAGPPCGGGQFGVCPNNLMCLCCELGGPRQECLCTTSCTSSEMCTDSARPTCDVNALGGPPTGLCRGDDFTCCWGCD